MAWETDDSSGFLSAFNGTVKETWFGTDPRYNNGETTILFWNTSVDEVLEERDGEIPEELPLSLPVGSGWESEDGATVEHIKGKDKFHASSVLGKLVDAVMGTVANYGNNASRTDGEELVVDLGNLSEILPDRGEPTQADVWKDLRFEFREILFDFGPDKQKKDGSHITSRRTLPVKFLGLAGDEKPKQAAKPNTATKVAEAKKKAADKAKAKAAEGSSEEAGPLDFVDDEAVREQLVVLLKESPDYDTFVNAALEVPEVGGDDKLLAVLLDEQSGPWASRVAANA